MKEILTEHFHIYNANRHIICYFEIQQKERTYTMWIYVDHKIKEKTKWIF